MILGPRSSPQKVSTLLVRFSNCSPPLSRRVVVHAGRLYQVEYAMEAIEHAGTCLGILASDGVLLAAERKITNKLLDDTVFSEKIYRLDE